VRFVDQNASNKKQVLIGRITTVFLMIFASILAPYLTSAEKVFKILMQIGAGTGLLFLLRWFWWRINAYSEIAAMVISLLMAIYFEVIYEGELQGHERLCISVAITTIVWIVATFITRPTSMETLKSFVKKIRPHQVGWQPVIQHMDNAIAAPKTRLGTEIGLMFLGCVAVYAALFMTGYLIYGQFGFAGISAVALLVALFLIKQLWTDE
jgi:hypothetical protein